MNDEELIHLFFGLTASAVLLYVVALFIIRKVRGRKVLPNLDYTQRVTAVVLMAIVIFYFLITIALLLSVIL